MCTHCPKCPTQEPISLLVSVLRTTIQFSICATWNCEFCPADGRRKRITKCWLMTNLYCGSCPQNGKSAGAHRVNYKRWDHKFRVQCVTVTQSGLCFGVWALTVESRAVGRHCGTSVIVRFNSSGLKFSFVKLTIYCLIL